MNLLDLKQYEYYFFRSPSVFNTQPWVLEYTSDEVRLYYDEDRILKTVDPTHRDFYLSMGAFIETVLVVAKEFDINLDFKMEIDESETYIGKFVFSIKPYLTEFNLHNILQRQTSRLKYERDFVKLNTLNELRSFCDHEVQLSEISGKYIKDLFVESDKYFYSRPDVIKERYLWSRYKKRDPKYYSDGVNAENMNLYSHEAWFIHLLLKPRYYFITKIFKITNILTYISKEILEKDHTVIILTSKSIDKDQMIRNGRTLQKMWLLLAKNGYYSQPLSQLIDCPQTNSKLKKVLGKTNEEIFCVYRVGKSLRPEPSYRLVE